MTRSRRVYFPSADQELLLKAALLDAARAIDAWNAWRALISVDDLDLGSQRLLPLLHQRLCALGVNHRDMGRYRSVHRHMWVANQLRVRQAVEFLDLFGNAAIPVILMKGIALAPLYYSDLGQRPMNDLDLLVTPENAKAAGQVLALDGWDSPGLALLNLPSFLNANHATTFTKRGNSIEVDLHWHASPEGCWDGADNELWAHAQDFEIGGVMARTLSDTDHLFHTCVHGARPNEVSPIRWVADALMIMRRGKVEWRSLPKMVNDGGFCRRLGAMFTYLREEFAAPIPKTLISELAAGRRENLEVLEELLSRRHLPEFFTMLSLFCTFYLRNPNYRATPLGLLRYMKARWGTSSLTQALSMSIQKSMKHVFKKA